jgi:hypothetical protein
MEIMRIMGMVTPITATRTTLDMVMVGRGGDTAEDGDGAAVVGVMVGIVEAMAASVAAQGSMAAAVAFVEA